MIQIQLRGVTDLDKALAAMKRDELLRLQRLVIPRVVRAVFERQRQPWRPRMATSIQDLPTPTLVGLLKVNRTASNHAAAKAIEKELQKRGALPKAAKPATKIKAAAAGHRFAGLSRGRIAERGVMNKTEAAYAAELDRQKAAGEILRYWFEPFSLRLSRPPAGQPARITIDFMVLAVDGVTYMDDAKGTGVDNDAQRVAMKCAAEQYPLWIFRIVKKQKAGGWKVMEV